MSIILGITGGIAAYKSERIVRSLVKNGYDVKVILSKAAEQFVSELVLTTFSKNQVYKDSDLINLNDPMLHIQLAKWASTILIAPATANIIAKLAHGICDDLLCTTVLASNARKIIAPAMNVEMWENTIVQQNLHILKTFGFIILPTLQGDQACGDYGLGCMLEPDAIIDELKCMLNPRQSFKGKTILITAGPTLEKIDPVRYITNSSSGKMGYALAKSAKNMGADVILVSGPTHIKSVAGIDIHNAGSAEEMCDTVLEIITSKQPDIFISCAAVADYTPIETHQHKLKKSSDIVTLKLKKTKDILSIVSQMNHRCLLVGFAAETENLLANAQKKLKNKHLDMVIANDVSGNKVFGQDDNEVYILTKHNQNNPLFLKRNTKSIIADQILIHIAEMISSPPTAL